MHQCIGVGDVDDYTVDVTRLYDNEVVWRTIINGYPYKSISDLGVENKYDAFVATKQAVYCALYDWDVDERYRGEDDRGKAIVKAMEMMVKEGREGTQTIYTAGVKVNKVGSLKEDGNYYSQEFKIDCGVDVGTYIVKSSGIPTGATITDTNNNSKTSFSGNENFKVRIPKSEMYKDLNIAVSVTASAKTYPIFYRKNKNIRNAELCSNL